MSVVVVSAALISEIEGWRGLNGETSIIALQSVGSGRQSLQQLQLLVRIDFLTYGESTRSVSTEPKLLSIDPNLHSYALRSTVHS